MLVRRLTSVLGVLCATVTLALAHEPLWGETPTIFGPYVFHPEIHFGFHGGSMREGHADVGLQYGINRFVNVKVTLPMTAMEMDESVGGAMEETRSSGVGDALLAAKYRFFLEQEKGYQLSQALVAGWKLPTGEDDHLDANGVRLPAGMQPGSGQHGVELGYAVDRERLKDNLWFSTFYMHDFGDGFRRGDMWEADAAYGRWVVLPNVADDLGINLAVGAHAEWTADDFLEDGASAGNAHRYAGVHFTPIFTKGRAQYRVGIFVPLVKGGSEAETDFNYEVRAGWEMFF